MMNLYDIGFKLKYESGKKELTRHKLTLGFFYTTVKLSLQ